MISLTIENPGPAENEGLFKPRKVIHIMPFADLGHVSAAPAMVDLYNDFKLKSVSYHNWFFK
jgi:hypothetical protein